MAIGTPTGTAKTRALRGGNLTAILVIDGKKSHVGNPEKRESFWVVPVEGKKVEIEILGETSTTPRVYILRVGNKIVRISLQGRGQNDDYSLELNGQPTLVRLEEDSPTRPAGEAGVSEGPVLVKAPMAGKIASVKVATGDRIEEGQPLIVLEAMKMENEIAAPKNGTVKEIYVQRGALARPGDKLVLVE